MKKTIVIDKYDIHHFPVSVEGDPLFELWEEVVDHMRSSGQDQVVITIETQ